MGAIASKFPLLVLICAIIWVGYITYHWLTPKKEENGNNNNDSSSFTDSVTSAGTDEQKGS